MSVPHGAFLMDSKGGYVLVGDHTWLYLIHGFSVNTDSLARGEEGGTALKKNDRATAGKRPGHETGNVPVSQSAKSVSESQPYYIVASRVICLSPSSRTCKQHLLKGLEG